MGEDTGRHLLRPPPQPPTGYWEEPGTGDHTSPGIRHRTSWPPRGNTSAKIVGAVLAALATGGITAAVVTWGDTRVTDEKVRRIESTLPALATRERVKQLERASEEQGRTLEKIEGDMGEVKTNVGVIRARIDDWARAVERSQRRRR